MVRDSISDGRSVVHTTAPSMLDLLRLSPDPVFLAGGEDLYRRIARLTEVGPGTEVLTAACGRGTSTIHLATAYAIACAGVERDANLVREAETRALEAGVADRVHFQRAELDDLPYRDETFDVTIGELSLATATDPARAIQELARVTRPLGAVVLVQLIWTGNVEAERREHLVRYLGARPMMLVEWKQMLRDAGVVDLVTEDWSDRESPFRPKVRTPFPDFAEIFTLRQKMAILRRALRRWGWRGVRGAIVREAEVHRLLTRDRVLGLTLIKGTKWNA
jgi:ubiquinone/menaquinone biosynthesis C-methylase UbiE